MKQKDGFLILCLVSVIVAKDGGDKQTHDKELHADHDGVQGTVSLQWLVTAYM